MKLYEFQEDRKQILLAREKYYQALEKKEKLSQQLQELNTEYTETQNELIRLDSVINDIKIG